MRTRYVDFDDRMEDLAERLRADPATAQEFLTRYELSWLYHENALEGIVYSGQELATALQGAPLADAASGASDAVTASFSRCPPARAALAFVGLGAAGEVALEAPGGCAADAFGATLTIENRGAGHAVPTGASFLRDLWVDLERDGRLVAPRVMVVGDRPTRAGRPVALLTEADAIERGSLGPAEATSATLEVDGPVEAVLRARAFRADVLVALGLPADDGRVPTLEIARSPVP